MIAAVGGLVILVAPVLTVHAGIRAFSKQAKEEGFVSVLSRAIPWKTGVAILAWLLHSGCDS